MKKSVAVIGSGISGLSTCWLLHKDYDVTLFEKNDYIGGHTHTVDVEQAAAEPVPVDTGFIVYNEKNYPNLVGLFKELQVDTQPTAMTFSFSKNAGQLEYSGSGLKGLFAQKSHLFSIKHWLLLKEILRFNKTSHAALANRIEADLTLGDFLSNHKFSNDLTEHYLLPMGAAIWSCPVETMMLFPAKSFLRFFANHGLIDLRNRPQWRTVVGGSSSYVRRMLDLMNDDLAHESGAIAVNRHAHGVSVKTANDTHEFDSVVFACHADEALALLGEDATQSESEVLGHFAYEPNETWLHTDTDLMPKRKSVWSCWNYLSLKLPGEAPKVCVSYWMNRLQRLNEDQPYIVTLNPPVAPDAKKVIAKFSYQHPVFSKDAMRAQHAIPSLQGEQNTWFCGSYCGYGFHEDGITSAVKVCEDFGITPSWQQDAALQQSSDTTASPAKSLKPDLAIS